jgi:hypothetical protein
LFVKYLQYAPTGEHAEEARSLLLTAAAPTPLVAPTAGLAADAGALDAGQVADAGRTKPREVAFVGAP